MSGPFARNLALDDRHTFGVASVARWFVEVHDESSLDAALEAAPSRPLVLGGGSNVLPLAVVEEPIIRMAMAGRKIERDDGDVVLVRCGAGEDWDGVVTWCLEQGLFGIENLALIPGTIGAAPIQNIGAYGVELSEVFEDLLAVHLETRERRVFSAEDCAFGYRDSVFKRGERDQWAIVSVRLRLSRRPTPRTEYGAIMKTLQDRSIDEPTPADVADAVRSIRRSKLPDPRQVGNAGSFFKNPIIPRARAEELEIAHRGLPVYPVDDGHAKLAAGWLIEAVGYRGLRRGAVGSHERQALCLVNHGGASGDEVLDLAGEIEAAVLREFGVSLEREVRVIGARASSSGS